MWWMNSSIGRKAIMAVTGIALMLFLTFHASMNVVAIFTAQGYNAICEMLGANWYAVVATALLALLVLLHFVMAFHLVIWNLQARGSQPYEVSMKPKNVEWSSQNMFTLGTIVILGLGLHLYHFWSKMMLSELSESADTDLATNGIFHIVNTFHGLGEHTLSGYIYTLIYLIWLIALWFHLTHGMWSAMHTMGWSNRKWLPRLKTISMAYSTLVILMFAVVAVSFCLGHLPSDIQTVMPEIVHP